MLCGNTDSTQPSCVVQHEGCYKKFYSTWIWKFWTLLPFARDDSLTSLLVLKKACTLHWIPVFIIQLCKFEYKYPVIFYSWFFCTVKKKMFKQSPAHATLLYPALWEISRSTWQKKKSSWMINNLSDMMVCRIAWYFYFLFVFWLALQGYKNTAQLVKILSFSYYTPNCLIRYI